jgi:hypothetical protein
MTTCEEFEVAIEMQLHGALDAPAAAQLEEHLRTCPTCRSFQTLAKQTEQTMSNEATLQLKAVNWTTQYEQLMGSIKAEHRGTLKRGLLMAALTSIPVLLMTKQPWLVPITWGIALGALWFRTVYRQRELTSQSAHRDEFLYRYRRQLERRLRGIRISLVAPALIFSGWVRHLLHGDAQLTMTPTQIGGTIALAVVAFGGALYLFTFVRPRLLKQLAALKQQ